MAASSGWSLVPGVASSNGPAKLPKEVLDQRREDCCASILQCRRRAEIVLDIPFLYKLWHLYLEPLTALGGVYHLHWAPEQYFAYMPQTARYAPESQIVCDQLAASYLFFAVIEGLVLRTTNEINVWRAVVFALLVCDMGHLYAAWMEMGMQELSRPWLWRGKDTVTMMTFVVPFLLRVAFLCEVGFKNTVVRKKE